MRTKRICKPRRRERLHSDDSLKVLGLGLGASEAEVKAKYRALSRIYHPDKHDPVKTGMSDVEASDFFKLINNAQSYLREVL